MVPITTHPTCNCFNNVHSLISRCLWYNHKLLSCLYIDIIIILIVSYTNNMCFWLYQTIRLCLHIYLTAELFPYPGNSSLWSKYQVVKVGTSNKPHMAITRTSSDSDEAWLINDAMFGCFSILQNVHGIKSKTCIL